MKILEKYKQEIKSEPEFSTAWWILMSKLCYKLKSDLSKAAREKNQEKILELYEVAKIINMDRTDEVWSKSYNKIIDRCNDVLFPI